MIFNGNPISYHLKVKLVLYTIANKKGLLRNIYLYFFYMNDIKNL